MIGKKVKALHGLYKGCVGTVRDILMDMILLVESIDGARFRCERWELELV